MTLHRLLFLPSFSLFHFEQLTDTKYFINLQNPQRYPLKIIKYTY